MQVIRMALILKHLVAVLCTICYFSMVQSLRIGSFNIQVFGESKSQKADVMDIIGKILTRYDIVLIMEIRDSKNKAMPILLETVESYAGENQYDILISERVGRTNSKEQYAYLYRKDAGLEIVTSFLYDDGSEEDKTDKFEREPFVVHFKSSNTDEFSLIGIHVDPDLAAQEISALEDVIDYTQGRTRQSNIMVLGDLNADCAYISQRKMKSLDIRHRADLYWPIDDDADTTTSASVCAYDRFIVKGKPLISSIKPNSVQVFDFKQQYGLSQDLTLKVSDHYPIELELQSIRELNHGTQNKSHSVVAVFFISIFTVKVLEVL